MVTTSNIVADWAEIIGGDRVEVFSLHSPGGDPHNIVPGARDVARVADADIVLSVGLGLETAWLEDLVHNASADESKVIALGDGVDPLEFMEMGGHGHDDHDDHMDEGDEDHGDLIGRLIVADAVEAHLSVIDLSTDDVDSGIFEVAAPRATVYASPTDRYGIVLARGPEDDDDRIHVFDGGVYLVEHGDHYDLVTQPVSRHSLEIAEERPIHYVNSHGWTAIFADAHGHVFLINEADLAKSGGDYEPVVLEAGPQHGAALVISDDHVVVTTKNPDYPENTDSSLPVGVEVRDFDDHVVYDASNRSCPGMHGESHNEHGVAFGCIGGVLFLHGHDGEYEHDFIANPPEIREDSRIGSVYGHHHVEHFFGRASYRGDQGFVDDGIWLIDVDHSEMRQVFSEPSVSTKFSSDGELLYVLGADGVLHTLDAHDGDLIDTMKLVEPGEAGRPAMIVAGEWLYVADPNSGHVLGVHLEHMEVEEEWHIGGAPSSLAFVGIDGEPDEGHDDHDAEFLEELRHVLHEVEDGHITAEQGLEEIEELLQGMDHHGEQEEEVHEIVHQFEDRQIDAEKAIEEIEHIAEGEAHDDHGHDAHGHEGHDHGPLDPHFWFDPNRVKIAVNDIAALFSALDPDNMGVYVQNAIEYGQQLDELHVWIQGQVSAIPQERRLLVTSHDTFAYFADIYGFEVIGAVIPSLAPDVEPSAEHLAELVEVIREHNAPAVFSETTVSGRLPEALARETGAVLAQLYADSLGEKDGPAGTYLGMMRANVAVLVDVLN